MCDGSRPNEWSLLKEQFDLVLQNQTVAPDSAEKMFDARFHSRFAELINRIFERNSKAGYIDWSRR